MTDETAVEYYLESIRFERQTLQKASLEFILQNFSKVVTDNKRNEDAISSLPYDRLKEILSSDDLNVTEELQVLNAIERWIVKREKLDLHPDDDPSKNSELWTFLSNEEKKQRQESLEAKDKALIEEEKESSEAKDKEYAALEEAKKPNWKWNKIISEAIGVG